MVMDSNTATYRLLTLGAAESGKTSLIHRFMYNTYSPKYKQTVEDLYTKEITLNNSQIKVDILDTAGVVQFPAMRRLSINTSNAFLLVYDLNVAENLAYIKNCMEEICELRKDWREIPIVICGNKVDIQEGEQGAVKEMQVEEWISGLGNVRLTHVLTSAKENINVIELFKAFLPLAQLELPLKRRSSAYVKTRTDKQQFLTEDSGKSKPRSRSLIRRSSKKKPKDRDASTGRTGEGSEDCVLM